MKVNSNTKSKLWVTGYQKIKYLGSYSYVVYEGTKVRRYILKLRSNLIIFKSRDKTCMAWTSRRPPRERASAWWSEMESQSSICANFEQVGQVGYSSPRTSSGICGLIAAAWITSEP